MSQRVRRSRLFVEQLERRECPGNLLSVEPPLEQGWPDPAEKVYEPIPGPGPEVLDPLYWKYEAPDFGSLVEQLSDEEWSQVEAFAWSVDQGHDYLYADDFTLSGTPADEALAEKAPVDDQLVARAQGYYVARLEELTELIGQSTQEQARLVGMLASGSPRADVLTQTGWVRFSNERVVWAAAGLANLQAALNQPTAQEAAVRVRALADAANRDFYRLREQVRSSYQQLGPMPTATAAQRQTFYEATNALLILRGQALEAYRFAAGLNLAIAVPQP